MRIPHRFLGLIALVAAHPNPGPMTATALAATTCGESPCSDSASAVPTCAVGCLESAAGVVSCGTVDYACQCSASDGVQSAAQDCVLDSCGLGTALQVVDSVRAVCACVTASPTTSCSSTGQPATPSSGPDTMVPITLTSPGTTTTTANKGDGGSATTTTKPTKCADRDCGAMATTAIPSCAQACLAGAATSVGCDAADYGCQCAADAQSSLSMIVGTCVLTACKSGDMGAVLTGASSVCACANATPDDSCTTPTAPAKTKTTKTTKTKTTDTPNTPAVPPIGTGTVPTLSMPTSTWTGPGSLPNSTWTSHGSLPWLATSGGGEGGWFGGMPGGGGPSPSGDRRVGEPGGGSGSGPGSGGAGGHEGKQTLPTTESMPESPHATAGASGRYGMGFVASVAIAVLAAALAL